LEVQSDLVTAPGPGGVRFNLPGPKIWTIQGGMTKNLNCGLIQEIMMGFFTKCPDGRTKPWNPCVLLIQEIMVGFFTKRPDRRTKPWNPCVLYY
jgi:hypothetical protein